LLERFDWSAWLEQTGNQATLLRPFATGAVLKHPIFWLMFLMMSLMSTSVLMVISQMGNFAADFGVAKMLVWGLAALPCESASDRDPSADSV
jgi:hypothetical protein